MADLKLNFGTGTTVYDPNATLANLARKGFTTYDNSSALDLEAIAILDCMWDTTAPTARAIVAELYYLPSPDNSVFPEGGDGTVGEDDDPQRIYLVGQFECVNPSLVTSEQLGTMPFRLWLYGRFVLKNLGGYTISEEWTLTIHPVKRTVA